MKNCPKCGSEAIGWVKDKEYDPEAQKLVMGYYKCAICGKRIFEKENG